MRADGVPGDLGPVDLRQVRLDVAGGHALGVQRDHIPGEAIQPALALAHCHRREARVAIPRHPQLDLANLGGHRLGVAAVAAVARPSALGGVGFIAQMVGHLDLQAGLEHLAHQRGQQAVVAGQLDTLAAGPLDQLGRPVPHRRLVAHRRHARTRRALRRPRQPARQNRIRRSCGHGRDPPRPATLGRGPSDHARLNTPSDSPVARPVAVTSVPPRAGRGRDSQSVRLVISASRWGSHMPLALGGVLPGGPTNTS